MTIKKDLLNLAKELKSMATEGHQEYLGDILKGPHGSEVIKLRQEAYNLWQIKEYSNAIAKMKEASELNPVLKDELNKMEGEIAHKNKLGKVNFNKTINKYITPKFVNLGFTLYKERGPFWFERNINNKNQVFSLGRDKWGRAFGFTVFKQDANGKSLYFSPKDFGEFPLPPYNYLNQNELDNVVKVIVALIDAKIIPWLES